MIRVNCKEKSFEVLAQLHLNGTDMEFIVGNTDYRTMNKYEFAARFSMVDGTRIEPDAISRVDGSFMAEYTDRKTMEAVYYTTANRWNLLDQGKATENISPLEFYERFEIDRTRKSSLKPEDISLKQKFSGRFFYRDQKTLYFLDITNHPSTWMISVKEYHEHLGLGFNTLEDIILALRERMEEIGLEEIAIKVHHEYEDYYL